MINHPRKHNCLYCFWFLGGDTGLCCLKIRIHRSRTHEAAKPSLPSIHPARPGSSPPLLLGYGLCPQDTGRTHGAGLHHYYSGWRLVVTDVSGNGETLTVSEQGGGNILFSVPGRNFSIDGGPDLPGNSGSLSLAGVTSVIINPGNGNDTLNVGAFTGSFPSLTINGDAGNDTINLNGEHIMFATDANLESGNDSATPGTDVVNLGAGANLLTAGSGTITIKCSWNVTRLQAPA